MQKKYSTLNCEYYVTVSLPLPVPSSAYHYYLTFSVSIRYNHSSRYKNFTYIIYVCSIIYRGALGQWFYSKFLVYDKTEIMTKHKVPCSERAI